MSNVEYKCPHTTTTTVDGEEVEVRDCGNRHFALPGGTKLKCRLHDMEYVQTEVSNAPDFLNIEEDGRTKSKDKLVGQEKLRVPGGDEPVGEAAVLPADAEQLIMRGMYKRVVGEDPDMRWGAGRIKDEIDEYVESLKPVDPEPEPEIAGVSSEQPESDNDAGEQDEQEPEIPPEYELIEPGTVGTVVEFIPN